MTPSTTETGELVAELRQRALARVATAPNPKRLSANARCDIRLFRAAADALTTLQAERDALKAEWDVSLREATQLAVWLHRNFYAEVTQWRPLADTAGVISQIDNMVAGVSAQLSAATARAEKAAEALRPFKAVYKLNEPLSEGWPDNKPNSEFIPGVWPDWNDFRRAAAIHAELTQEGGDDR